MEPTLNHANIVLDASDHEPDLVTREWLERNNVLKEKTVEFVYRQGRLLVETANYSINLVQQQLTIAAKNSDEEVLNNLQFIAKQYIDALPNVSYNAVGLNFNWQILPTDHDLLKQTFVAKPERFSRAIGDEPYGIGGIVYYQYPPFQVYLLIISGPDKHIIADFNYHSGITDFEQLSTNIFRFTELKENARNTIRELLGD